MLTKVFKKLIALSLLLFMCSSTLPTFAAIYSPGPITYDMDKDYLIEQNNAEIIGYDMTFKPGGTMTFDLLLPFDSDNVTVFHDGLEKTVDLDIVIDSNTYSAKLNAGTYSTKISIAEIIGSHTVTFIANKEVAISNVRFGKINEKYNDVNSGVTPLTDYEYAVLTSVIVKNDASVVKTRGAFQRWDVENIYLTPMNINGSLYVPFSKFSEALGFYSEDYPEKSYIYMTGETQSLTIVKGKGIHETDTDQGKEVTLDVIYKNGYTWVPLRKTAEMLGFTVEYRDGYAVIDDRLTAREVVENDNVFKELCEEFSEFISKGKITGKTYHVAQTAVASDANSGTEKYPFRTIERAAKIAKAGDTVIIHEGTYREILKPENNGTFFAPITFMAAEGEKVTLSALEPVSNFIKYKDDIYVAAVPTDLGKGRNQLFYKGEALVEGRHPNEHNSYNMVEYPEGLSPHYATKGDIAIKTESSHKGDVPEDAHWAYSDTSLNQTEKDYWKGGTFVTMKGEAWSLVSGDIIASEKGRIKLKNHDGLKSYGLGMSHYEGGSYRYYPYVSEQDYGYITNHINTVDKAGEWYIGDNKVYVIPPKGADLNKDFEVKQRQIVMDLSGRQYISIKNIDSVGGGMTMNGKDSKGNVLNGGNHTYVSNFTQCIDQHKYELNPDVKDGSMQSVKAGEVGFYIDGEMNAIVNSIIDHSAASCVIVTGKYHYIHNNILSNGSYMGGFPGCIWLAIDSSTKEYGTALYGGTFVTRNTVFNGGRGVLWQTSAYGGVARGISAQEIAYNRFFNGALNTRDTGVTYEYSHTGGNDKSKTRMHHNFVYDPGNADEGYLGSHTFILYHDGQTGNRETFNNVVYNANPNVVAAEYVHDSAASVLRSRNNAELGFLANGEADITIEDFPGERPFNPGSFQSFDEQYLVHYESFMAGRTPCYPETEKVDEETGKEIYTFKDIEINDDEYTQIDLFMLRRYGAADTFEVNAQVFDKSGKLVNEATLNNTLKNERFYVYDILEGVVVLPAMKGGKYDIKLTFSDTDSDLLRIQTKEAPDEYKKLFRTDMILGGTFDAYTSGPVNGTPTVAKRYSLSRMLESSHLTASNTWDNTLVYKDREVLQKSDMLRVMYGTGTPHHDGTINVYVDSLDSEPIAKIVCEDTNWKRKAFYIPLERELEAGTYTFYFEFVNNGSGTQFCTDFNSFKFIDKNDEEWKGDLMNEE